MPATAFILNMDSNGLGVARSLGREEVPTVGVDFRSSAAGLRSRFCRPMLVNDPAAKPEEVLDQLSYEGKRLPQKGVLYPTSDAFVLFVSRHREQLSPYFTFALPSESIVEGLIDKRQQYADAFRIGIPIPATFNPRTLADVEDIKDRIDYPAFIKPCYSHVWQSKFGSKGFTVTGSDELAMRFNQVFEAGLEAMVQSIIMGPNTNHFKVCGYFGKDGNPLALFVTQKIRQFPTDFGVGTLMKSVHNEEVLELGSRYFRGINYRGVGSIEFKRDERDGEFKMIELNARLWQQNYQATAAGVNFPLIQHLDLTGQAVEPVLDYRDNIRWFDAIQDFQAFRKYRGDGTLGVVDWTESWLGSDCYAYFAWDDPRPGWTNSQYGWRLVKLPFYLLKRNLIVKE